MFMAAIVRARWNRTRWLSRVGLGAAGRERSWAGTEAEGGYCTPLLVSGVHAAFARRSQTNYH